MIIATDRATILYYSRQYDRAIAECQAVLSMDPRFGLARSFAFYALVKEGKFAEALEERHKPNPRWRSFVQLAPQMRDRAQASIFAYIGAGRKDQAMALLQKAYSEHANIMTSLKVDPRYDSLRDNPRFQELLRSLRLTQ